jgi:acyl carrier protein
LGQQNNWGGGEMNELLDMKLKELIARVMRVDIVLVTEECSTDTIAEWDSLGHMRLILALEEEFNLTLNERQIMQIISFVKVRDLVESMQT